MTRNSRMDPGANKYQDKKKAYRERSTRIAVVNISNMTVSEPDAPLSCQLRYLYVTEYYTGIPMGCCCFFLCMLFTHGMLVFSFFVVLLQGSEWRGSGINPIRRHDVHG